MLNVVRGKAKNDRGDFPEKEVLKGRYYLGDRDEKRHSIEEYVIEVYGKIIGVFTPAFQKPTNRCLKLKDKKTKRVLFTAGSHELFHTRDECINYHREDFEKNYIPHMKERLKARLKYTVEEIEKSKKRVIEIQKTLEYFEQPTETKQPEQSQ